MVSYCNIPKCKTKRNRVDGVKLHKVPKVLRNLSDAEEKLSSERREKWIFILRKAGVKKAENALVCSKHFIGGKPSHLLETNHQDWLPNVSSQVKLENYASRYKRLLERNKKKEQQLSIKAQKKRNKPTQKSKQLSEQKVEEEIHDNANSHAIHSCGEEFINEEDGNIVEKKPESQIVAIQADLTSFEEAHYSKVVEDLRGELAESERQIQYLKNELQSVINEKQKSNLLGSVKSNGEMLKYYTGLESYCSFEAIYMLCEPVVTIHKKTALNKREQLLLTLMKLHLKCDQEDLGYRFGISQSTVSRIFVKWITVLHARLPSVLIDWPDKSEIMKSISLQFKEKESGDCVSIIDPLEVFCDRPRDDTWF